jgi:outer membrane protein TolC
MTAEHRDPKRHEAMMGRTLLRRWASGVLVLVVISVNDRLRAEPPKAEQKLGSQPASPVKLPFPLPRTKPLPDAFDKAIPIDWPTVLELARASNLDVQLASERIREAHAQVAVAKAQWWPGLKINLVWRHHEGRDQEIDGRIIEVSKSSLGAGPVAELTYNPQKVAVDILKAKQLVFARSGALDRATREALQEASLAYVDLVAAQAGAAISTEIADLIGELVRRYEELHKQGLVAPAHVYLHRSQFDAQKQFLLKAQQGQLAAGARLVQLLELEPGTRVFTAEDHLVPLTLVDENQAIDGLIERAMNQGPGLAEVIAMLSALDQQEKQLRRIAFLPTVSADVGLGTFGGGIGSSHRDFDDRTDIGLRVYWDVMRIVGTSHTRELFGSKRRQASLEHQKLRSALAAGITVALDKARSARERITLAENELRSAIQSYEQSDARLRAATAESLEVLQAIAALSSARKNYLDSVIDYNRAQVQLHYLVGHPPGDEQRPTQSEPVSSDQ